MLPPHRRLIVAARVLASVGALCAAVAVPAGTASATVAWGNVLVPGYQWAGQQAAGLGDLNVYSNGDGNEDKTSTFGLSYECVELAQRYAAVRFGEQPVWPVSAAYQMWAAGPNLSIPFVQHPNGGADTPQSGDLLIFGAVSGAPYGHVAVVADTGPDYVDIVEQNWDNLNPTGTARLPISGTTMPARNGLPIVGWLRSGNAAAPYKPVVINKAGQVIGYAGATTYGGPASLVLAQPLVGATGTPSGRGYWMVAGDGGVFSYGDAQFYGSTGNIRLNQPVVGMASTPDGQGYWLVASDGGIFTFGDAQFYGSTGNIRLNQPVVGMAATPDGKGYWLVASDGGIFSFGDAQFYGSTGNIRLNKPVTGMAATHDGKGYWMVASDGTLYAFGDAKYLANTGVVPTYGSPVVAVVTTLTQQ